jgi:hypothetical protein
MDGHFGGVRPTGNLRIDRRCQLFQGDRLLAQMVLRLQLGGAWHAAGEAL